MKITANISLLLFLGATLIFPQEQSVDVVIKTNSVNSIILVDNEYVGNGHANLKMDYGIHFIKIKEAERKWDANLIQDTILIENKDFKIDLNYSLPERQFLDTEPQDASVFNDEKLIGHTPLLLFNGFSQVKLSKKNYADKFINLEEINDFEKVSLDFTGKINGTKFTETVWFEVLIGTAVALGATAAHFKIQADKEYDKYLETTDRSYLDQTDQYDLYSGIAFGALQVNFGLLLYFLISE